MVLSSPSILRGTEVKYEGKNTDTSVPSTMNRQKSCDQPVVQHMFDALQDHCTDKISSSCLVDPGSFQSGAWLHVTLISLSGLHMPSNRYCNWPQSGHTHMLPHNYRLCQRPVDNHPVVMVGALG